MDAMSVSELWEKISNKIKKNKTQLINLYSNPTEYTKYFTELLIKIGNESEYTVDLEYWPRVDVSFFDRTTDTNWAEWAREVAIEIENDSRRWKEELDKLFAINAGKKVLITYWDKTDKEIFEYLNNDKADSFISIYKSRKYHQVDDDYLIIFGPEKYSRKERKNFTAFRFTYNTVSQIGSIDFF